MDRPGPGPADVDGVVAVAPGRPPVLSGRAVPVPAALRAVHRRGRVAGGGEYVLEQLVEVAAAEDIRRSDVAPAGVLQSNVDADI